MRRLALLLGVTACAPLAACVPTQQPASSSESTTSAPSVLAAAGTPTAAPAAPSYAPTEIPAVEPTRPVEPPAVEPPAAEPTPQAPIRARPISGGTLHILSDGRTAVASDPDRDQVYVVDLVTGRSQTVALSAGDEPGRIVEDANGLAHIALRSGGAIATLDAHGTVASVVARRAVCAAPRGLAFESTTGELHVACAGGELVTIGATPTARKPLRRLNIERDLRDVVVSTNGRLLVSTFRSASVYTIQGDGSISAPRSVGTDFRGTNPGVAWRMLGKPDGSAMMLHELAQQRAIGTFPGAYGQGTQCGGIVSSTVTVVAPDGDDHLNPGPAFAGATVAADVAVSPDGSQLAVVSIASTDTGGQVQFFDVTDGTANLNGNPCWPQSSGPRAPEANDANDANANLGDGLPAPQAYLPPNGQVVAVAYDARGNVVVQSREPASLQILTQRRDAIALSTDSRFDLGHQLFHSATSGQIACVSCHPEGGEDGRVWVFQTLGQRRTQSLRGGIMDTAPFHWSGDEANMTSLMKDVFQDRMSGGAVDARRVVALGQWIDQIPTVPVSHGDDATVARGKALFTSAGCAACHAGADFTNGQTVDVGTGGPFQVPQLHGLALRAPYMHNGCAPTLRARFTTSCGGDAKHLVGTILTTDQVSDLIGYLETL